MVWTSQLPDAPQHDGAGDGVRGGPDVRGSNPANVPDPAVPALGSVRALRQRRPGHHAPWGRRLVPAQRRPAHHHLRQNTAHLRHVQNAHGQLCGLFGVV